MIWKPITEYYENCKIVKTEIIFNEREKKTKKKLNLDINLLTLSLAEGTLKLQKGIMYKIHKKESLFNLVIWNQNYIKKRGRYKQFLEVKILKLMKISKKKLFEKLIMERGLVDLRSSCDLQLEKKKKCKVKMKEKNINEN
jgi:hypothetical protein